MLLTLAEAMISPALRSDLEASDLVQQTLMEAHCNAEQLVLMNAAVVFSWLRSALQHNMLDAIYIFERRRMISAGVCGHRRLKHRGVGWK